MSNGRSPPRTAIRTKTPWMITTRSARSIAATVQPPSFCGLAAQLAAGGEDVPAAACSEDRRIVVIEQDLLEGADRLRRGGPERRTGKFVEGDQVQFTADALEQADQLFASAGESLTPAMRMYSKVSIRRPGMG